MHVGEAQWDPASGSVIRMRHCTNILACVSIIENWTPWDPLLLSGMIEKDIVHRSEKTFDTNMIMRIPFQTSVNCSDLILVGGGPLLKVLEAVHCGLE